MNSLIQVKDISNQKWFVENYYKQIARYNDHGRYYLVSYAEKVNRVINSKCLFVYCKINNDDAFIGYTKVVKSKKHPMVDSCTDIKNKIKIKDIISYSTIDQTKLSIKSLKTIENEAENIVFQFPNKEIFGTWLNYFIDITSKSLQSNLTSSQIKENEYYRTEVERYAERLKELEERCRDLQGKKEELEGKKERLDGQKAKLENQIFELEKDVSEKEKKIEGLENQLDATKWKIKQAQNSNAIKDSQMEKVLQKIAVLEKEGNQKQQKNIALLFQLETAKQSNKSEGAKFQEKEQSYRKMIEQQMNTIKNRQDQINSLKALLQTAEDQAREWSSAVSNFWTGLNAILSSSRQEQIEARMEQQAHYSKEELIQCLKISLKDVSKLKERKEQLEIICLFSGNSLDNYPNQKAYLKKTIEKFHNRKIVGTRMLYKFDPANKINFHHYIDNQSNIVLVVKTGQGSFVAGYSESPFNPSNAAEKSGILMSLTQQKHFNLQEGKRAITYDDYYIIFGNSEIRLKSLESKIFSNFGIANGYYENRGMGVQTLLGQNKREIDLETYEVHKVLID